MKNLAGVLLFGLFLLPGIWAQEQKFTVELSADTILLGNYLVVKFTLENMQGKFEPPSLGDFDVIGGPNTSTSISMINGEVRRSSSYSYFLQPRDLGVFTIPPAFLTAGEEVFQTAPLEIIVVPNPDGIIQQPNRPSLRFEDIVGKKQEQKKEESKPVRPRKRF